MSAKRETLSNVLIILISYKLLEIERHDKRS